MTTIIILAGILQSIFISLGVGSSTLAILNFFAAIKDGTIDAIERHMMGVVYLVLRIAMMGILLTTVVLQTPQIWVSGFTSMSVVAVTQMTLIAMLFLNATLMTRRLMPSTFGPGIQAGTWYSLGLIAALQLQGLADFSFGLFLVGYVLLVGLAVGVVNLYMKLRKQVGQ